MAEWNEAEHPRDDDGKFTYKNGGNQQSDKQKMQNRADILFSSMANKGQMTGGAEYLLKGKIEMNVPKETTLQKNFEPTENTNFSLSEREKARIFIQQLEGFREDAYKDIAGVWTIGYGRTENVKPGDKITKEEAEKLFSKDFDKHKMPLENVKIPLSTNEKIALTSFIYNEGPTAFRNSTLLKKLNNGDKQGAANEFDKWIYSKGKISQGLINRRKIEKKLFLTPDK